MFTGAATAIFLLNLLYRIGVSGDVEREREAQPRAYFESTENGRRRRSGSPAVAGDCPRE
jgi:hypothetical protein